MRLLCYDDGNVEVVLESNLHVSPKNKGVSCSNNLTHSLGKERQAVIESIKRYKELKEKSSKSKADKISLQEVKGGGYAVAIQEGNVGRKQRNINFVYAHNTENHLNYEKCLSEEMRKVDIKYTSSRKKQKEKEQVAAIIIQCMARKSVSKSYLRSLRQKALVDSLYEEMKKKQEEKATLLLQRAVRTFLFKIKQNRAALVINCMARRLQAKNHSTSLRETEKMEKSAITIQSAIRSFLAKTSYVMKYNETRKHKGRGLWSIFTLALVAFIALTQCCIGTETQLDDIVVAYQQMKQSFVNKAWSASMSIYEKNFDKDMFDVSSLEPFMAIPSFVLVDQSKEYEILSPLKKSRVKKNKHKKNNETSDGKKILKAMKFIS